MQPQHPPRTEPRWIPARRLARAQVPDRLIDWLLDVDSLTRRLQALCPGRFSVQLHSHRWARPMRGEARLLGCRRERRALIREVHLYCGDTPLVFARTVIPLATLTGPRRRLARLGSRPLGATLFADRSMRRGELQVTRLRVECDLFAPAVSPLAAAPETVWGRRSLFRLADRPLLVSEFFLTDFSG